MKHKLIFTTICFALIGCLSFTTNSNYSEYCNSRFQFCIDYPKDLLGQGESENGDGQLFMSKDKQTEVRAYGMMAIEEFDKLSQQYESAIKDLTVSYKVIKSNWFIFSGTDKKGNIVYRKTVKKKLDDYMNGGAQDVFQTLMISYPVSQKKLYDPYCAKIAKSL